jgi:GDP-L-fucose synthase
MDINARIFLAGHKGMVGSALQRVLEREGYLDIVIATRQEVDLRDTTQVSNFFHRTNPEYVLLAAAKVGGIQANRQYPADFIYDNLMIQNNVIHQSYLSGVKKIMFLGSSCVYPKECAQPMKEDYLLTGPLESTNEAYALAKISGLRMAQYYQKQYGLSCVCPMPSNLYGPNDSFDLEHSHVLSALVRRFTDAVDKGLSEITLWGSGIARREFLHVDDVAAAIIFLMNNWNSSEIINVGAGKDISIRELAGLIAEKVGFTGEIKWDTSMPDGMLRKCLDISKLNSLGFVPKIALTDGIDQVIREYRAIKENLKY